MTMKRDLLENRILWVSDLINMFHNILAIEGINMKQGIRMDFLGYRKLKIEIRERLEGRGHFQLATMEISRSFIHNITIDNTYL